MSALAMNDEEDEDEESKIPSEEISTAVICSLIGGKIESATVDIVLEEESEYILQVTGKNAVHLIGNYIDQTPMNLPPGGEYDSDDNSDDSDAYDLRDVSSDVMMDADDLDSDADRFEEVDEDEEVVSKKTNKRPRPSEEAEATEPLTKAQKKAAKKQKATDGSAIPAATPAPAKEKKMKEEGKEKKEKESQKEKKAKPVEKTLAGGLKVIDASIGSGPVAKKGDKLKMRYIGKLENGRVFDKNTTGAVS
jgi:FK506-binding nuclear protein